MASTATQPPGIDKAEVISETLNDFIPLASLEPVDKHDTETCKDRARQFFTFCRDTGKLPTVELLSAYMGRSRETLRQWERDKDSENGRIIEQCKGLINANLTQLAANGDINPIYVMFLQKCNMGYVEPKQPLQLEVGQPTYSRIIDREQFQRELEDMGAIDESGNSTAEELPPPPVFDDQQE